MNKPLQRSRCAGFTLVEVTIASFMLVLVLASSLGLFISYDMFWREASVWGEANHRASMALNRMVYGIGTNLGLRAAGDIVVTSSGQGWVLDYFDDANNPLGSYEYRSNAQSLLFTPGGGGTAMVVAQGISQAQATLQTNTLALSFTADRNQGRFSASRQLRTTVRWRN